MLVLNGEASSSNRPILIGKQYLVQRPSQPARPATILDVRTHRLGHREAYITFPGQDKRLDNWVPESEIGDEVSALVAGTSRSALGPLSPNAKKRRGGKDILSPREAVSLPEDPSLSTPRAVAEHTPSAPSTPEREHAAMTKIRNFEDVRFGEYLIKTWYYSPYPMPVDEITSQIAMSAPGQTANGTPNTSKRRKLDVLKASASHLRNDPPEADARANERKLPHSRSVSEMFAAGVKKGGEGARGRLWVCDLCFKYMRTRAGWERHTSNCEMLLPPGRRVYQKGSYTIWEVDGAITPLYCQNLSLFGGLFIDHKSVFFHVENFLFYVICDAATSRRDQVMAFFSKEKLSYDDYNLACIVTFPPFQGRGFGKLLIEFSYYLTLHPSTRPASLSPGTPERPLSDLGLKGYTAYWNSVVLRLLRRILADAPPLKDTPMNGSKASPKPAAGGRELRKRSICGMSEVLGQVIDMNGVVVEKTSIPGHKGQYAITLSLLSLSKACHLRPDDMALTLSGLGFLQHRRPITKPSLSNRTRRSALSHQVQLHNHETEDATQAASNGLNGESTTVDVGEWKDMEVVITKDMVEQLCLKWAVKDKGVLDESCVLL